MVERDGNFWVENMPLGSGANSLTLTVRDSAGNVAVTNITVLPSDVSLSINMPSSDQLWNQGITVSGTISDWTDYAVWVNGVKATVDGYGNWTAANVDLPAGDALFQARAIPMTDTRRKTGAAAATAAAAPVSSVVRHGDCPRLEQRRSPRRQIHVRRRPIAVAIHRRLHPVHPHRVIRPVADRPAHRYPLVPKLVR